MRVEPVWTTVSLECKMFIKRMLSYDPAKRASASEALRHPFITSHMGSLEVSGEDLRMSLSNLRNFRTQTLFQKAVLTYLASQQLLQQDEARFRRIFDTFDLDRDGQLTTEELVQGYASLYGDPKRARKQAEQIMKNIDLNHNGTIEYNGITAWVITARRVPGGESAAEQRAEGGKPKEGLRLLRCGTSVGRHHGG
ncbi:MAG: EF-hand domain-containing protein [Candidatus Pacebacteria bacterium]|nr:EF-hand domain-containing protein [Candidatus Paceibacterota bacterium]